MLALQCFFRRADQAHAQRTRHANGFQLLQRHRVIIDIVAKLSALVANVCGVDEYSGNPRRHHRGRQRTDPRHVQLIDRIACGKQRRILTVIGRVEKFQHNLCGGKGHTVQLKIAAFLHLTIADRHAGNNGFADIGLPDTHLAVAAFRQSRRLNQPGVNGEGPRRRRQIAAIATPIHKGLVN